MKKLILLFGLVPLFTTSAMADYRYYPRYNNHYHYHYNNNGAAIGLGILGGVIIGNMLARPHYYEYPRCYREAYIDQYGYQRERTICDAMDGE